MKKLVLAILSLALVASAAGAADMDASWLNRVPEQARERANPAAKEPEAHTAGAKLFEQHCAACHGKNAEGKGRKPSLHSSEVQNATDGELFWLLTNGNIRHGMPSWSRLPDEQRWQIVSFLKRLGSESAQAGRGQ
ncbi:MAG TPA: c-type cytochrome [Terriglobales bacterium]